jgi:hypothetical protein
VNSFLHDVTGDSFREFQYTKHKPPQTAFGLRGLVAIR